MLLYVRIVFVFKYTSTTDIHTYGHSLSLPHALPIYLHRRNRRRHHGPYRQEASTTTDRTPRGHPLPGRRDRHRHRVRSEEHTSELQSLMRISYAVFCLKKKNIDKNTIHIT